MGTTVTGRLKEIKQPRGGLIKKSDFTKELLNPDSKFISLTDESLNPALVGLTVDYLTRYQLYGAEKAFAISRIGLHNLEISTGHFGDQFFLEKIANLNHNLDQTTILTAAELASFDTFYRTGYGNPYRYKNLKLNEVTYEHIKAMVFRTLNFLKQKTDEKKLVTDFNFDGGYTQTIINGDGDFHDNHGLWDLKVSKQQFSTKWSLQIVVYYLMGLHSYAAKIFQQMQTLGIYNPRYNLLLSLDTNKLTPELRQFIDIKIIGY
ncbi:hypothetical protein BGL34_06695 [Fructilactobacillus lindneri]|uniref:Uncharacterized protein n=1 Tax=Fructilactobacillus lindneri TaxID=53444 RepID=A0AB33BKI5_9LACO|nr:hypothetical protein [Fructilactobacillus lindneri]ANZ57626.1 hypothetical protein AYR60_02010 [Fructilactobacillus lindneri]ANZ58896.1 hypothetical protein AYR59_02010 [Fructilactobacillus lindneri]POG97615.1 hypothetical protein BGL31_06670 [Fructilactobacillus lindneri]POH03410.1 hypothetical protein BGL32_06805 [Fructilactobacillus lindneri]POH04578.1 hypothetical protein BGL33_06935 [Fructilactobacillus lindneri]